MKKLKTITTNALTWLKASRRHQIIVAAIIVVLLAVSASAIILISNNKSEGSTPTFDNPGQTEQKRVLHVTSNILGITMSAMPKCDDNTTEFKTPKDCSLAKNQSEVIVTAPSHAVVEGKTYIFKSWDGCSASNEDWKICKFIPGTAAQAKLTANYLPLSEFTSKATPGNAAPQPNQPAETPKPKNLREQCESSKVSSTESNSVRCTVASDGLFLGFDWNNKPEPSPQPPITVKCLEINTMDCKVRFTYAPAGTEPAVIKRGASLVVNSTYKIGRQNPGPAYPSHVIGGTAASTGETQNNEVSVTLSAPLSFATGEHTYQFTNYSIYVPSYQRAGTSSDYFNWIYDTSN